jgi:hypothetical protein
MSLLSANGRRRLFAAVALITITIGLGVHLFGSALNSILRDVTGDILWAVMMYWLVGAFAPRMSIAARSAMTYAICTAVELSQLYHARSLDALRGTTPGHLVLGSGFDPRDLVAYAAGVGIAILIERAAHRRYAGFDSF